MGSKMLTTFLGVRVRVSKPLVSFGACAALWLLVLLAVPAKADSLLSYLNSPNVVAGFVGTAQFDGDGVGSDPNVELKASVDYAVFAPNHFSAIAAALGVVAAPGFGQTDPTDAFDYANDYVYGYQIFNDGDPNNTKFQELSGLSVF